MHRWKVQSQLGPTNLQTMKAKKRPTKRMMAKLQNLQIRNQSENIATGHHLGLEMVQLVMTRMFSPRVKRPSIPKTTFPFIAFKEPAGYFSCIFLICSKIARRCQTSISRPAILWLMDPLYRVVSGQVYPGTLTHMKLELPHKIWLGSTKFAVHSSQEFVPSRTFHIQIDCILLTISGFEKPVTYFHCGVHTLSTHCQQSGAHVPWLLVLVRRWVVLICRRFSVSMDMNKTTQFELSKPVLQ